MGNKGTYVLILRLSHSTEISRPRKTTLREGIYVYVGSAMNSLTGRIKRHLKRDKKEHWHIDQLTTRGEVIAFFAITGKRLEEELSMYLAKSFDVIKEFGSSDVKSEGNLFFVDDTEKLLIELARFLKKYADIPG